MMPFLSRWPRLGWFVAALMLGLGLLFSHLGGFAEIQTQSLSIPLRSSEPRGPQLVGRLYQPPGMARSMPLMILHHGASSNKEFMAPLARELATWGIPALIYDAGGFGESYDRPFSEEQNLLDAAAVLAYVQAQPQTFDQARIGLVGHSMGGATVLALAHAHPELLATVSLGMQGVADTTMPPNLLLGIGLYEHLHPPGDLRQMLAVATANPGAKPGMTYGQLEQRTARQLVISGLSEHATEPFSSDLIGATVSWLRGCLGRPMPAVLPLATFWILGQWLTFTVGLGLAIWGGCVSISRSGSDLGKVLSYGLVGGAGGIWLLAKFGSFPGLWASDGMMFLLLFVPLFNIGRAQPGRLICWLRLTLLYVALVTASVGAIALLRAAPEIALQPQYLGQFPLFLLRWPVMLSYLIYQSLRGALFSAYSFAFQVSLLFWLPLVLELVRPGIVLGSLAAGLGKAIAWLRQPLQIRFDPKMPKSMVALLVGLVGLLVVVLGWRGQQGMLSGEMLRLGGEVIGQLVLFPAIVAIALLRQPWFRRWEQRCQ